MSRHNLTQSWTPKHPPSMSLVLDHLNNKTQIKKLHKIPKSEVKLKWVMAMIVECLCDGWVHVCSMNTAFWRDRNYTDGSYISTCEQNIPVQ